MSKLLKIFICLTLLLASVGCTQQKSDESTNAVNSRFHKYTFDEAIKYSHSFVKAKCTSVTINEEPELYDEISYTFEVTENFYGEDTDRIEFALNSMYSYLDLPKEVLENNIYESGKEYYLLLVRTKNVYKYYDRLHPITAALYLPADDISKASLHCEPLSKTSQLEENFTKDSFIDYVTKAIFKDGFGENTHYIGTNYITSDNINDIIDFSDTVAEIEIKTLDQSTFLCDYYVCEFTNVLKGEVDHNKSNIIMFFPDTVNVGEKYIVALTYDSTWYFSSPNSLFDISQHDEISSYINN